MPPVSSIEAFSITISSFLDSQNDQAVVNCFRLWEKVLSLAGFRKRNAASAFLSPALVYAFMRQLVSKVHHRPQEAVLP
jgi:hypothetical protein